MEKPLSRDIVRTLLRRHGRTFAEELDLRLESGSPEALFGLLVASLLFSVRIGWKVALSAAETLRARGWTTPSRMAASTWEERVRALDEARYVRYDESRARMLGEMAGAVLARYGGDLRNLRKEALRDARRERELIEEFKGIGPVGAGIFLREVQVTWDEVFPFIDERALKTAGSLGLPTDTDALLGLVGRKAFPGLVAALVRTSLSHDRAAILEAAQELSGAAGR